MTGFSVILQWGGSAFFAEGFLESVWVEHDGAGTFIVVYLDKFGKRGDFGDGFSLDSANRFASEIANVAGIHDVVSTVMVPDAREYLDSGG